MADPDGTPHGVFRSEVEFCQHDVERPYFNGSIGDMYRTIIWGEQTLALLLVGEWMWVFPKK